MKSPLTALLLILTIVLLLHVMSILLYHQHHDYNHHPITASNQEYITAVNNLNSSLTTLHARLVHKKRHPEISLLTETTTSSSSSSSSSTTTTQQQQPKLESIIIKGSMSTVKTTTRRAVLFTMDSITGYESNSEMGGASGEITVRRSLEEALKYYHVVVHVIRSDDEFNKCNAGDYDLIVLDPWTWAKKGWVPKDVIRGHDDKIYILDFFGSEKLRGSGLNIPASRMLTAFGSKWNTFLGYYYIEDTDFKKIPMVTKKQQGVIWGKDIKHYTPDKVEQLKRLADSGITLISTSTALTIQHPNVKWIGHLSPSAWQQLLAESKFLIGLGDPLLGPSAIDAITFGCVYVNPHFDKPKKDAYFSQHPYAEQSIGEPFVCSYRSHSFEELQKCATKALGMDLPRKIPTDFTKQRYLERVLLIFPWLEV